MSPGDSQLSSTVLLREPLSPPGGSAGGRTGRRWHWHSEGFFGAVLLGEKVTEDDSAEAQGSRARSFLQSALDALIVT